MNTNLISHQHSGNSIIRDGTLHRLAAFAAAPGGGNPAGVWLGAKHPTDTVMRAIAADIGYSETVFAIPTGRSSYDVRYFSPMAEVPFCGHATIALGAALGAHDDEPATYQLTTRSGAVELTVRNQSNGLTAELTSVMPSHSSAPSALLTSALDLLDWRSADLDHDIPPAVAFAGAHHLVIAVQQLATLADMRYDFDAMRELMQAHDLTTLQLIWRSDPCRFIVRKPFPIGGIVEDPATGAAAAALGGYLRDAKLIEAPTTIALHQGDYIGRPSRITVDIPKSGGISVGGRVLPI